MDSNRVALAMLILLGGLFTAPARAETFNTCHATITSLPAVITSQGVYCLAHDLSTALSSGNAIDIQTNNVTIDCNGYKIGGLAAGTSSLTIGIAASGRQNTTVRNCGIRGFLQGIHLESGAGNLIEDNRLDNNLAGGLFVDGDNNRVRRNAIYDTGGYPGLSQSAGMSVAASVTDNIVSGVFATGSDPVNVGIYMYGDSTEARGNVINGVLTSGAGTTVGIQVNTTGVTLRNNSIAAATVTAGSGIGGHGATDTICIGNTVHRFATPIANCQDGGGNSSN